MLFYDCYLKWNVSFPNLNQHRSQVVCLFPKATPPKWFHVFILNWEVVFLRVIFIFHYWYILLFIKTSGFIMVIHNKIYLMENFSRRMENFGRLISFFFCLRCNIVSGCTDNLLPEYKRILNLIKFKIFSFKYVQWCVKYTIIQTKKQVWLILSTINHYAK